MTCKHDLFSDLGPEFAPQPDRLEVVAGKVVATMNKPSAVQKRFNTLMARIDAEQALAQTLHHAMDMHGPVHRQALREIHDESQRLCKSMVLFLDERIQASSKPKGLTARQKQQAVQLLVSLCEQLAATQDNEVDALLARYVQTDEEDAADQRGHAQALAQAYLGGDFAQGRTFNSPEEVIRAAMEFEQKKMQAQADKREAKRAQRKAQKGLSASELAAEQKQQDAQNALRTVYRQLASALHPDREPDEQVRARKTTLMSEVNAAYERKDLSTLLRIQLQAEMVDTSRATAMSEARLKAMCDLLAEQVRALEMDNLQLRHTMAVEFGYAAYGSFSEAAFLAAMLEERDYLQADVAQMREDLHGVQDDKGLKAWLKEQTRANKTLSRASQSIDLDDVLFSMMRGR